MRSLRTKVRKRLGNVGDALSQLLNVAFLPGAAETDANESVSGRAYRQRWSRVTRVIDSVVFWQPDHCRRAYEYDVLRAKRLLGIR